MRAPASSSRSKIHEAAVAGSTWTGAPEAASASSAGPSRSGASIATPLPRWRSSPGASLRRSMNSVTLPSSRSIANDSGSGVCGTSPPRMLSSQAIDSGLVSTAAAAPSSASARPSRVRFAAALSPAKRSGCGTTGASGAGGRPGQIRSIGLATGLRLAPARARRRFAALDLLRRVQPRVVADDRALGGSAPASQRAGRLVDQVADLEQRGIGLRRRLQRIAAVDEERGALGQHDRQPGRAGEAGQPGEPLAAGRHVFALMLVGARHDEAVEPARRQLLAQQREPRRARQPGEILGCEAVAIDRRRDPPSPLPAPRPAPAASARRPAHARWCRSRAVPPGCRRSARRRRRGRAPTRLPSANAPIGADPARASCRHRLLPDRSAHSSPRAPRMSEPCCAAEKLPGIRHACLTFAWLICDLFHGLPTADPHFCSAP